jgi:hypothetical protein
MKRMATECGTFVHLREGLTEEERERAESLIRREVAAIDQLIDELGRPPTNAELQARLERRKRPRPMELTYECDEGGFA